MQAEVSVPTMFNTPVTGFTRMSARVLGKRVPRLGLTILLAMVLPQIARGQPARVAADDVLMEIGADDLVQIMRTEGYAVSFDEDGDVLWKLEGFKAFLFVAKDGEAIQFHSSFSDGSATLKRINEWNQTKRFSRSYLDDDGDPHLELDLELTGGVTRGRLVDFLKTCRVSFTMWCKEVVE